mgnify:FL=1
MLHRISALLFVMTGCLGAEPGPSSSTTAGRRELAGARSGPTPERPEAPLPEGLGEGSRDEPAEALEFELHRGHGGGHLSWHDRWDRCAELTVGLDPIPHRPPHPCVSVHVDGSVAFPPDLWSRLDALAAEVPTALVLGSDVRIPDTVTMEHVIALTLLDAAEGESSEPSPRRAQFPAVRYLHSRRDGFLPEGGWLEADDVSLGVWVDRPSDVGDLATVAERVVGLEVLDTFGASFERTVGTLPNLRSVEFETPVEAGVIAALPTTLVHFSAPRADDRVLRALTRFDRLRSLALPEATLTDISPLRGRGLRRIALRRAQLAPRAMAQLAQLRPVEHLDLSHSNVDEGIASALGSLHELATLSLGYTRIGDRTAEAVGQLEVHSLDLSGTAISDAGVIALEPLDSLRSLSLRATSISRAALAHLPPVRDLDVAWTGLGDFCDPRHRLRGLRTLDLSNGRGTRLTDGALRCLSELSRLTSLSLAGNVIGDSSMTSVASLQDLRSLDLTNTRVGDRGIEHLASLPRLRSVQLFGLPITDRSAPTLRSMRLQSVDLRETRVSEEARGQVLDSLHIR